MPQPNRGWLGGVNYFRNLLHALRQNVPDRLEPVVFLDSAVEPALEAMLEIPPDVQIVRHADFAPEAIRQRTIRALVLGTDPVSANWFRSERIDVIFETVAFYGRVELPVLAWFADFQHRRLPHLFPWYVRLRRDLLVRAQLAAGRLLMLSSKDAEADALRFFARAQGRTAVVPFALPAMSASQPLPDARAAHGLPDRFLYLPNQLWTHKNHMLVIEAMGGLRPSERPVVAATGAGDDPRAPGHRERMMARIAELRIEESFRMLGVVPYAHVQALMRQSVAVLNPSLFEGWSTTVEECKQLGVPMLLSDIPVHREQAEGEALFFSPTDQADVAAMLRGIAAGTLRPTPPSSGLADERHRIFALRFAEAAERSSALRGVG